MSSNAPNSQSLNYTHMFNFADLNIVQPINCYKPNSIMNFIGNCKDTTFFAYIVRKSGLESILDDSQLDSTVFVPSDRELLIKGINSTNLVEMSRVLARAIVQSSMITNRITSIILEDSPACYFETVNDVNRMFITNIDNITKINGYITVIGSDIYCNNGIIHIIDGLIAPLQL